MNDTISLKSTSYKALMKKIEASSNVVDTLLASCRPTLQGERFLSSEEVCRLFHITRRTCQEYRDQRIIPFTSIGGKILYPESKIQNLLERNSVTSIKEI